MWESEILVLWQLRARTREQCVSWKEISSVARRTANASSGTGVQGSLSKALGFYVDFLCLILFSV